MNLWQKLTYPIPVYVTRPKGDGTIGSWTVGAGWGAFILLLWVTVAIGTAVQIIVGWFA